MANELIAGYLTGATLYAVLWNEDGEAWNGSAFEAYNAANWSTYDIALTEKTSSGRYYGTFPAAITTAGNYSYDVFVQQGGSPAVGDAAYRASVGEVRWTGSAVENPARAWDGVTVEGGISAGAGLTNDSGTQLTRINGRQAVALAVSALGGKLAGGGTTNETFKPVALPAGNTRIDATVDSSGNRTTVNVKVPD